MARPLSFDFQGPFRGLRTQLAARNLLADMATASDNCVVRDGHLTQRPGVNEYGGEDSGDIDDDVLAILHVAGKVDYAIAAGDEAVHLKHYDDEFQPTAWGHASMRTPYAPGPAGLLQHGKDAYIFTGEGVMVHRDRLDDRGVELAGMSPYVDATHNPEMAIGSGTGLYGTVRFWISRYNELTGLESNAIAVLTSAGAETLSPSNQDVTITLAAIDITSLRGVATHVRIYQERTDGQRRGLLATVEIDEETGAFSYSVGANESNGGSSYDPGTDDTDLNYAPPTQNGLPPDNTVAMAYHDGRMFYLTDDGYLWFSQAAAELQGHVEHVSATSFLRLEDDSGVGIRVYREALFIFGKRTNHRLSGSVNSLTNDQVFDGSLADELEFTAFLEPIEGSFGSISRDSIIEAGTAEGGRIYYAGADHAYIFDGMQSVPLTRTIQNEYVRRVEAVGVGGVSCAWFAELNLIAWCFKDLGVLTYDHVTGEWLPWDVILMPSPDGSTAGAASDLIGPVCEYREHQAGAPLPMVVLRRTAGASPRLVALFDQALDDSEPADFRDSGVINAIAASWTGGYLDLGTGMRRKRYMFLHVDWEQYIDGPQVENAVYQFGIRVQTQDGLDYPAAGEQLVYHWKKPPFVMKLGFRAQAARVHLRLSKRRMSLVGYAMEGATIGHR